jgi:hypothetical protein
MNGIRRDRPAAGAWRAAVLLGLALVAATLAFAVLYPLAPGHGCPCRDRGGRPVLVLATPRDLWVAVAAARYVAEGALGFVYESSRHLTALPLWPVLLAPLVAAGQALGLSEPPAPTATMYLLLGPFTAGLSVPLLRQVRGLVRDAAPGGSALAAQAWTALLVGVPALVLYGHGEDALALLGLLAAVRLGARGRWTAAGLLLSGAVASKQWAVLALPALVAWSPRERRARLVVASLALPAALALFVLAVDWPHASRALLQPPNYPGYGHAAPWVHAGARTVATAPFRLGALALGVALAWRCRAGSPVSRLLAVLGVVLLARCAFEPVVHPYYLAPGLCLLLLHERAVTGRCRRTAATGSLLLAWFAASPAPPLWWAVAAALGATTAYRATRELLLGRPPAPAPTPPAATAAPAPAGPEDAASPTSPPAVRRRGRAPATATSDSSATGSHQ